jgi:transposase
MSEKDPLGLEMPLDDTDGLSQKEQLMKETIQKILYDNLSIEQAAVRTGCCKRTIRRRLDIYLKEGAGGLAHKSRKRAAQNRIPHETEERIVYLYENRYQGYNFTHFNQKLKEAEGIAVAYATVYAVLVAAGHRSPKAHRQRKAESLHPLRRRRAAFGELVQMDASVHEWFAAITSNLHLAIDDATSKVLGAHFEESETLHGYYMVFAQILGSYGVPEEFYTDRRTVFCTARPADARREKDAGTQFRLAAHKLGVLEIHTSSVPQAKGRVERAFQTFQDRLISEMRSAKIASIDEANAFLPAFIAGHNARYALDSTDMPNAFAAGPGTGKEIGMALSVVKERTVMGGSTASIRGAHYAPFDKKQRYLPRPGTKAYVLHTLDDELYLVDGPTVLPLLCMETLSTPTPEAIKDTLYIPPKDHPWRGAGYDALLKKLGKAS